MKRYKPRLPKPRNVANQVPGCEQSFELVAQQQGDRQRVPASGEDEFFKIFLGFDGPLNYVLSSHKHLRRHLTRILDCVTQS